MALHSWNAEAAGGRESGLEYLIRARDRSEVSFIFSVVLTSSHFILILKNDLA